MFSGKKIALGYEIKDGPWGGGNKFLISIKEHLEQEGAQVVHQLEAGLDLIIIINPRKGSGTFSHLEANKYKRKHPKVKVIHRINETDKAKNTNVIDRLRIQASKGSDAVIFISDWIRDYYVQKGFDLHIPHTVIRNGADERFFNPQGYRVWNSSEPMNIVTHHWSDNRMKGADIYQYFDELLDDQWLRNKFQFTLIGRWPKEIKFRNAKLISPLVDLELAKEIKKNHVYLTGARWEACAMHPLEGACCGLPVLFINEGGGMTETCRDFGIKFSKNAFLVGLFKMTEQYSTLQPKMKVFPFTAARMIKEYEDFIAKVLSGG